MRLHRLRAVGLLGLSAIALNFDDLPADARTVSIVAPNGSGKSTTIGAILASLYLTMPDHAGDLADQFRDRKGEIELHWSYFDAKYRSLVKVAPKGKEAFLYLWDETTQAWSTTALPETPGGVNAYLKAINDRFMPLSESLATWFSPQRKAGQFHTLDRREKKAFVRRRLNLERLLKIAQAAADRAAELGKQIDALATRLATIETQQTEFPALRAQLAAAEATLAEAIAFLQRAVDQVVDLERRCAALAERLEGRTRLDEELGRLEAYRQAKRDRYEEVAEQSDVQDAVLGRRPEITAAAEAIPGVEAELTILQETLATAQGKLDALQARLLEAGAVRIEIANKQREFDALMATARGAHQAKIAQADANLREATIALQAAQGIGSVERAEDAVRFRQKDLKNANQHLASVTAQVDLVDKVGCKVIQDIPALREGCLLLENTRQAQAQQADIKNALEQAADALKDAEAQAEVAKRNRETTIAAAQAALAASQEARRAIPDVPAPPPGSATLASSILDLNDSLAGYPSGADLAEARQEIATVTTAMKTAQDHLAILWDLAGQAPLVEAAERRLEELNREALQIQEQGLALKSRIEALQAESAGFDQLAANLTTLKGQAAQAGAERERLDQVAGAAREAVGRTRGAIATLDALTAEATAATAERAQLLERKAVWEHIKVAFEAIPNYKLDAAGPQVSALVNQLLNETFGTRFRIEFETLRALKSREGTEEVFDIRVIDAEQGTSALLGDKSGGECVIIGEALSLGLSLWSAIASGKQVETLIRDEADGALSADRVVGYFHMLDKAGRIGGFHRQFFVTHRQELQELADARLYLRDGVFTVG